MDHLIHAFTPSSPPEGLVPYLNLKQVEANRFILTVRTSGTGQVGQIELTERQVLDLAEDIRKRHV